MAECAALFPLRLSAFEKFVLWDERPRTPMTAFVEMHFNSPLDEECLLTALTAAVHRNPLLACRVEQRSGDWWWVYDPRYVPQLLVPQVEPPVIDGWPRPIDLTRECGGRYWYGPYQSGWRWLIQFHHACSDGMGVRQIVLDTFAGYAQLMSQHPAASSQQRSTVVAEATQHELGRKISRLDKLNTADLLTRDDYSHLLDNPLRRRVGGWQKLKNAHYFHWRLPQALRGTRVDTAELNGIRDEDPMRHAALSRETSTRILEIARQRQLKINDLALTLMFQTCVHWNQQRGDEDPQAHIRLLMPYDLRSRADLRLPAANRLSFAFLGRDAGQCHDFEQLLASVQAEVQAIKDTRLPLDFLDGLKLAARWPRGMRWVIQRSRRMATAVLTYTGDMSRGMQPLFPKQGGVRNIGDSQITKVQAAAPIRENTNISMGLCVNWGQLCFSAAWNRAAFTTRDCEEFLQQYVAAWAAWERSV